MGGSAVYQIRVHSCLDDHWVSWFEGMELSTDEARNTTMLIGSLPDQAALYGILARIRDMGLPLLSLSRLDADADISKVFT
jgi:hypothetical protein